MTELLPCPFCGGEAEIERMGTPRASMIIACTNCGCRLESGETFINENCNWNTRHKPEQNINNETIERLKKSLEGRLYD